MRKHGISVSFCLVLFILPLFCLNLKAAGVDTTKYIFLDEIQADMEAYCLTVFSGTQVERFGLKVLSVVRGYRPGQNMILVIGTDERFQHAGTIHGCSGSPVFIDGRLAGALAAGWDGSLDALYMVRPIEDMLEVGSVESPPDTTSEAVFHFDLSGPMNLADVYRQSMDQLQNCAGEQGMLIPLSSSLPSQVCDSFRVPLHQMGFIPVSAPATLPTVSEATDFERGGVLSVVLCGGDISLAATGTVTDILGDQIYGFGHNFKGQGPTNLPITAGVVHAVVAGRNSSFKFSSPGPVLGTLQFDQSFGVRGTIGVAPKTIPLTIRVHRENAPESRTYNCYLASDRMYTPLILQLALNGAALLQGPLPPEHTVRYESQVKIKGQEPLILKNISSGQSTSDIEQNLYYAETLGVFTSPDRRISIKSWISATRNTLFIEIENIGLPTVMEPELWIQSGRGSTSECIQKKRLAWARRAFTANCQINTGAAITMCMPEHPQKDTSEDVSSVFLKNGDRAIIAISATSISRPLFRKSTENGGKTSGANRRFT